MKTKEKFIVQVKDPDVGWVKSRNIGADGVYTKASAVRRALEQEKDTGWEYRAKEIK